MAPDSTTAQAAWAPPISMAIARALDTPHLDAASDKRGDQLVRRAAIGDEQIQLFGAREAIGSDGAEFAVVGYRDLLSRLIDDDPVHRGFARVSTCEAALRVDSVHA